LTSWEMVPVPTWPRRYCLEIFSTFITVDIFREVEGI
jgi:hypothetical protein